MAMAQTQFYKLGGDITIVLRLNRICGDDADVIVNLTHTNLELADRCSLTNHIPDETLREIQQECKAKAPEDLELGEFVVTNVGTRFKTCYIYHCACWMEGVDGKISFSKFIDCLSECFDTADSMGQTSILIPVIGVNAFKREKSEGLEELAQLIVQTYLSLAADSDFKTKKLILDVGKDTFETFHRVLEDLSCQDSSFYKKYSEEEESKSQSSSISNNNDERALASAMGESMTFDMAHFTMQLLPQSDAKEKGARPKQIDNKNGEKLRTAVTETNRIRPGITTLSGNETTVKVYKGDITNVQVKVLVHGAFGISNKVDMTDAVGQALDKAGGQIFMQECKYLGTSLKSRTFAITGAGDMGYDKVMHVNTSACKTNVDWQALIRGCLDEADKQNIKTLAFPCLGADSIKPYHQAINFDSVIKEYIVNRRGGIEEIHIVLHDDTTYNTYNTIFSGMQEMKVTDQTKVSPSRNANQDFTLTYNGVNIVVKEGNIADESVDCAVHAYRVDNKLSTKVTLNDAIGKALSQKAGAPFRETCETTHIWKEAAVITSGGASFNTVLHIDTSKYSAHGKPNWESFIFRCLQKVDSNQITSVAFPVIGLYDPANTKQLADLQIKGAEKYITATPQTKVREIRFVIYNDSNAAQAYKNSIISILCLDDNSGANKIASDQNPMYKSDTSGDTKKSSGNKPSVKLQIAVLDGEISKQDVDMIVHGTSYSTNGIQFYGNLWKGLLNACGETFQKECREKNVPAKSFAVTTAGAMQHCRFIIHVDVYTINYHEKDVWKKVIRQILNEAEKRKMVSIAFPDLGMVGTTGSSSEARGMISYFNEAITEFELTNPKYLRHIRFLIHANPTLLKVYKEVMFGVTGAKSNTGECPLPTTHDMTIESGKGELDLIIVQGDLTKETTECIVHATQNPISFGGQSGSALRAAGGQQFEQECKTAYYKMFENTVLTSAGNLPCKWVLHLDMPNYKYRDNAKLLTERITECLNKANEAGIKSMSFPALGTGVLGFKPAEISKCFRNAMDKFNSSRKTTCLNSIRLVVFQQSMIEEFKRKLTFK